MLFSGFFDCSFFGFKVSDLSKLSTQDHLRYFSIIPSVTAISCATLLTFSSIDKTISANIFNALVDTMIVTLSSAVLGYYATVRSEEDYVVKIKKRIHLS